MRSTVGKLLLFFCFMATGCGEDTADEMGELPEIPACESRGVGPGIWGRVVVPNCSMGLPSSTIMVLDELQFPVVTVMSDAKGEFQIPVSSLSGDGNYILTATSGPYSGPEQPQLFAVQDGQSEFQIVRISQ